MSILPDLSIPAVRDAWQAYLDATEGERETYNKTLATFQHMHESAIDQARAGHQAAVDSAWMDYHNGLYHAWEVYCQVTDEARRARDIAVQAATTGSSVL